MSWLGTALPEHVRRLLPANHPSYIGPKSQNANNRVKGSGTKRKPNPCHESLAKKNAKTQDTSRSLVQIACYRCRLTDPDGGFIKYHLDAIKYGGWIRDDSCAEIDLEVKQIKVKTKAEEKTTISVTPIDT